jgi:hypothetical protein
VTDSPKPSKWTHQAFAAVVVVLAVAVGTRVAWTLLAPLVPGLLVLVFLVVVYALAFGRLRK